MINPAVIVAQTIVKHLDDADLSAIILCQTFGGDPKKLACYPKAEPLYAGQNRLHDIVLDVVKSEFNRRNKE